MPVRSHRGRNAVYRTIWAWPLRSWRHLAATGAAAIVIATVVGVTTTASDTGGGTTAPNADITLPTTSDRDYFTTRSRPSSTTPAPTTSPTGGDLSGDPGSTPGTTAGPRDGGVTGTVPPAADGVTGAVAVAEAWARAWVTHPPGISAEAWAAPMRPYTTPEYWPQLLTVAPETVPASAVTGPPVVVPGSGATAADVDVPTDALVLRITVVRTPDGWRVVGYDEAR